MVITIIVSRKGKSVQRSMFYVQGSSLYCHREEHKRRGDLLMRLPRFARNDDKEEGWPSSSWQANRLRVKQMLDTE